MFSTFFNMKENPFGETPDTRYFFKSASHMAAFRLLASILQNGKGFALLLGEVGLGKTIMCRLFLGLVGKHADTALIFNPRLEGGDLIRAVADEFGAPAAIQGQSQQERLTSFLLANARKNRRSVLFIDEAQALSVETLESVRLLSNLETEKQKLLQIVLFAQPELQVKLSQNQLRQLDQRISEKIQLAPLDLQDTETYIRHRIDISGGGNFVRFEEGALRKIFDRTGGVPRLINFLCESILLAAEKEGQRIISAGFVKKVIGQRSPKKPWFPWTSKGAEL